jgi:hypothetical protein
MRIEAEKTGLPVEWGRGERGERGGRVTHLRIVASPMSLNV